MKRYQFNFLRRRYIQFLFVLFAVICFAPVAGYSQTKIQSLVDSLTSARNTWSPGDDKGVPVWVQFKSIGKRSIPYLIAAIDRDHKALIGYIRREESNLSKHITYVGVKSAYMIEYLLSDSSDYHIYYEEVICRVPKPNQPETLTLSDLKSIKKYYQSWWQKNKGKSLKELQAEWKAGERPLTGTNYEWY